jgi:hypothetical protein
MRKQIISISIIFFCVLILTSCGETSPKTQKPSKAPVSKKITRISRVGEKIVYEVRLSKLRVGLATFERLPRQQVGARDLDYLIFETKLAKFHDVEKIYSDPETFLPVRIERLVSTWPQAEKITEDYDQNKFVLTIKKTKGKNVEKMVIKKDGCINNAILLPYCVRDKDNLVPGFNLLAKLPKQDFLIKLDGKQEVKVPAGKFMAYHFISDPKKFEIWISADSRRIPLKIKGANSLGYTLVMKEYTPGK